MRVRYSFSSRKTGNLDAHNKHRREFPELVRELIANSDIILEILDARFIEKTRNKEMEKYAKIKDKKIIYLLNKSDLIDINKIRKDVELKELIPFIFFSCVNKKGVRNLRTLLKIAVKKLGKEKVNVGVIGYPNTGKSSIINILAGKSMAGTSSDAGFTKGIQKIKLFPGIYLIDTPGVIPNKESKRLQSSKLVEIGVKMYNKVKEPEMFVNNLMQENYKLFEKFYNIKSGKDAGSLIEKLGKRKHFLIKGGEVDWDRTARQILKDWQEGKIR